MHRELITGRNIKLSARTFGKAQLHAISCRVFTEKLRDSHGGYVARRKRYIVTFQVSFHFLALRAGKRHMIESVCYVRKVFLVRPCLAQVENALIARVQPVSKTSKVWPLALFKAHYVAIEDLELLHERTWGAQIDMVETNRGHMDSVGIGWLLFEIGKSVIPLRHCFSAIQRFRRGSWLTPISGRSHLLHF